MCGKYAELLVHSNDEQLDESYYQNPFAIELKHFKKPTR